MNHVTIRGCRVTAKRLRLASLCVHIYVHHCACMYRNRLICICICIHMYVDKLALLKCHVRPIIFAGNNENSVAY